MKYHKEVFAQLEKCYSLAEMTVNGWRRLLAASEKAAPCYLLDGDGCHMENVWDGPGGVMSMVAVPGRENRCITRSCGRTPAPGTCARSLPPPRNR